MSVLVTATGAVLAQVPLEPGRDEARRWAVEELVRREYTEQRPGAVQRLIEWILEQLGRLSGLGGPGQGTGTTFALIVGVVVVLVTVAVLVTGRVVRRARQAEPAPVFDGAWGPARTHRGAADEAAARGDWRTAVVERFRAVVRELEERAVLVPQLGRTADEAADEAARWLPDLAGPLHSAARLFDDVRYGDRPADAAGDAALRALDGQVVAARTVAPADPATSSPAPAVPS